MRPCASSVIRPLTWSLKEVDPVGLHRQSGNGALCLNTPQHNGKSGTEYAITFCGIAINIYRCKSPEPVKPCNMLVLFRFIVYIFLLIPVTGEQ